jgi:hypothetical protein
VDSSIENAADVEMRYDGSAYVTDDCRSAERDFGFDSNRDFLTGCENVDDMIDVETENVGDHGYGFECGFDGDCDCDCDYDFCDDGLVPTSIPRRLFNTGEQSWQLAQAAMTERTIQGLCSHWDGLAPADAQDGATPVKSIKLSEGGLSVFPSHERHEAAESGALHFS